MELVKFQFHSSSGTELEKSGTLGPDLEKNGITVNRSKFWPGVGGTGQKIPILWNFPTYAYNLRRDPFAHQCKQTLDFYAGGAHSLGHIELQIVQFLSRCTD